MKYLHFSLALLLIYALRDGSGNSNLIFKKGSPIIGTSYGFLEGRLNMSRSDRLYFAFRGIPYAESPERFFDSEYPEKWDGLRNAMEFGNPCPQFSFRGEVIGDENCLFLNVYFPKDLKEGMLVPVIVLIDGVEFVGSRADYLGPEFFMDSDIVLVTINYRLGALGFLNTEDEEATGNMGMKDLILGLKWIESEIQVFGGDPEKVTVFGIGSGGSAVHFLILSPMAKGLFHNAISIGGTALNPFAYQRNPLSSARILGDRLGCRKLDSTNLVRCLRSAPMADIISAQQSHWELGPLFRFTPSIDKHSSETFLPSSPYDLMVTGKHSYVPWVIGGYAFKEGLKMTMDILENPELLERVKYGWKLIAPDLLEYRNSAAENEIDNISQKVWTAYFNDSTEIDVLHLENLLSDRHFWLGLKTSAFYHSKSSKIFACVVGTSPGDLNALLFNRDQLGQILSKELIDEKFSKELVKLWSNFAYDGKPEPTWKPDLTWRHSPPSKIGIIAPMKWFHISNSKHLSDNADRLHFWHTLGLNEFETTSTRAIKDEF